MVAFANIYMKTGLGWRPGRESGAARCTLEHVLDENAALSDLLVDNKLLIVGRDKQNHCKYQAVYGRVPIEMHERRKLRAR